MKKSLIALSLTGFFVFLVSGCGGSGGSSGAGSGDAEGLEIGSQMALVTPKDESSNSISRALQAAVRVAVPTSGQYVADTPKIYVYDESMQILDEINSIMCMMDQTGYADMVNLGNYRAMINVVNCEKNREGESENQSSGETVELEEWIINSSRTNSNSPQIVNGWVVSLPEDDVADQIRFHMVVTTAASDSNPFGEFEIDYEESASGAAIATGHVSVSLNDAGYIDIQMVFSGNNESGQVHAILTPGEDSGVAYASMTFDDSAFEGRGAVVSENVRVAFDSSHYLTRFSRGDSGRDICLDRQNFDSNVWGYNLYDANGVRVSINSGMGIKYGNYHGWAGYYGLWLPEDRVTITDGMEVTDHDGATYTVSISNGRVIKRTRQTMTLADLVNDTCKRWDDQSQTQTHVRWDGTNFLRLGTESCQPNSGCTFEALGAPEIIDLNPFDWFGCWKEGLGFIDLVADENGEFSNDMEVPYYAEEFILPGDATLFAGGNVTLKCYNECLKAPLTANDLNSGDVFQEDSNDINTPYLYTLNTELNLSLNGEAVALSTTEAAQVNSYAPNSWGVHSGAMVLSNVDLENIWNIWGEDVTYTYETGPNAWNRHTSIIDSNGSAVAFDPPLQCFYESDSNGAFLLDYAGDGELHGIPFEKIESEDEDSNFEHWVASFVIPNGTELTCNGSPYYVRQMIVEQRMQKVDASNCGALQINSDLAAASVTYTALDIGSAPEVTDNPKVIDGVVQ